MTNSMGFFFAAVLISGVLLREEAGAQFTQQGGKLVGSGTLGSVYQGASVDLSADGNTAIVGGYSENNFAGAAWVYVRTGGVWTQQGNKLVGTGAVGGACQGASVALSADGNTALVGGYGDSSATGAAWVFTRTNGVWSQQGSKLVGKGAVGRTYQGASVSLSADGNTAIVGGYGDSSFAGAAWVYTRTEGVWSQQGSKLVGTGSVGNAWQGNSVSLSGDGNTAIVGGYADSSSAGAAWIFSRSGGIWSQQGFKLLGTGAVGSARQGFSVSLSTDGNTAIVGGCNDSNNVGGVWIFARSGDVWTQQGEKLLGAGSSGSAQQGYSVSMSSDGNTAVVGGPGDNGHAGAAWVFTRDGSAWSQQGGKLVGTGAAGSAWQGFSISLASDGATIILGGYADSSYAGAAWVFTRSADVWSQQGNKLTGVDAIGSIFQGISVSLSGDGNTALIGGYADNSYAGAAWAFARDGEVWSQQGKKLLGAGTVGNALQGIAVSVSADGNTAIVGGYGDSSYSGATWIFTRSGGLWHQQGKKLVGSGAVGGARQGYSVSLSGDGNTALVGGYYDNSYTGAAWIFTRSGDVWSQQGDKLIGTGALGNAFQGSSVALSSDGTTALVGGYGDSSYAGAAWVFTRSGDAWTQQGTKLVGKGAVGRAWQGISVALSSDGNTALVGGYGDSSYAGAAWVFTRSGDAWTQQGAKLVGKGAVGRAWQGYAVSLSADGNTALVGGCRDSSLVGAAWAFTRSGAVWSQQGSKLVGANAVGNALQGASVSLSSDGSTAIVGGHGDNSGTGAAWVFVRTPTGFGELPGAMPLQFALDQNYPNPFNPMTAIRFRLPLATDVRLIVYDMLGREVAVLVDERMNAGTYEVTLDGRTLASGVYLCRIQAGGFTQTKRLMLVR